MVEMQWSFDDLWIGRTEKRVTLQTKEIPRPPGLSTDQWYTHAAKVCRVLNETPGDRLHGTQ